MSWFQRRERSTLQLYGKLPLAKDYLRAGMGSGAALALREWFDRGYSGTQSAEPPRLAHAMRFLAGEGWDEHLQGVAWPSTDEGGLRAFPFVFCLERRRKALLEDLEGGLGRAQAVWVGLQRLYDEARGMTNGGNVLSELRGKEIDVNKGEATALPGVDLDTWIGALWPDAEREGFYAVLEDLSALAESDHHLRLPLVGNLSFRHQVHAWVAVLCKLSVLPENQCPTLFFPLTWPLSSEESTPAFLTVFRHRPTPEDARWLDVPGAQGICGPGDLCPPEACFVEGGVEPVMENIPPLSESLRGPLTRFLARAR